MLKKLLASALIGVSCSVMGLAQAAGITYFDKFVSDSYWTQNNPEGDKVLLNAQEIAAYNKRIDAASRSVVSLADFPATYSGDSLKTRIMDYSVLDDDLYLRGNKVSENYKNILRNQTNVSAIPAQIKVRYAVTVRRADVRNLPTGEGLFYYAADHDFDVLQETSLDPGVPVAILHTSANGYFYYVQASDYAGWVSKFNLALCDRNTWLQYLNPKSFLVVTANNMSLKVGNEILEYQQGSRLPIESGSNGNYTLSAPARQKTGEIVKMHPMVNKNNTSVHLGYLPYTSNNILRSAFKFYNMPYGWGGKKNSVDAAGLLYNAYRTVGIFLPRDAEEQEATAGTSYNLKGLTEAGRLDTLKQLTPGAALFKDGHEMLYLGKANNEPYVLHSLTSYYDGSNRQRVMKVVVSDLSLGTASGQSMLMDLTSALQFE